MKASVIGLGQMGVAIAQALVSAGHDVTVWNRTPGKDVDNAVVAPTAAEAIAANPVALAVVSDYATVRELFADATGGALINLATGTPEEAQAIAEWAADRGLDYLDGAMLAVPQSVATPDAQFLYSGSTAVFDEYREMLDVLATSRYLGPDPTVAAVWDSALLGIGYSALLGYLHAAALLDTVGTSPSQFQPMVGPWLATMAGLMAELGAEIETGEYRDATSSVGLNRWAVAKLVNTSLARGVSAEPLTTLRALLDRAVADGRADESVGSLFELLRSRPRGAAVL
ncbi:MAG TPA: NAD(P)-binding domain-containing protein [Mycobacterium sp.]|nr:NAD(P)-binding domain-containing protein [Mycobacterium sp.]